MLFIAEVTMRISLYLFKFTFIVAAVAFSAATASADTINIPDDYTTIQAGIDASSDADTVLVQPGTYYENINFNGKNIVLGSLFITTQDTSYISKTVIDGNQQGRVVDFMSGEDSPAVLSGFVITNGSNWEYLDDYYVLGAGIFCKNSDPYLNNLIIAGNEVIEKLPTVNQPLNHPSVKGGSIGGAGIYCYNSNPIVSNVRIENNITPWHPVFHGGGVFLLKSNPVFKDVLIHNNGDGGIYCGDHSNPMLERVTITEQHWYGINCESSNPTIVDMIISKTKDVQDSEGGGKALWCINSSPIITNLLITGDSSDDRTDFGVYCEYNSNPILNNILIINNHQYDWTSILCKDNSSPVIINGTIANNSSTWPYYPGSINCISSSNPYIINTIIANNSGYGIYNEGGNPTVMFSNIWNNNDGNFYGLSAEFGTLVTTNVNGDPCDKYFNIQMDPLFINEMNYQLQDSSPCIGAGTGEGAPIYDFDGFMRKNPPDMGAYESGKSTKVTEEQELEPTGFSLYQNFPNPFNPVTSISFSLTRLSHVTLHVYNIGGAKVSTLVDDKFPAGIHNVVWDASGFSTGLYFCKMKVEKTNKITKMLLLK